MTITPDELLCITTALKEHVTRLQNYPGGPEIHRIFACEELAKRLVADVPDELELEAAVDTALQERITTVAKTVDARFDRAEQLIRSLRCLPPGGECTWKDGEQPYKCEFHPTTPWPGHRCPNHK